MAAAPYKPDHCEMGGLLLTSPITSLAELKREGLRVEKHRKKHAPSGGKRYREIPDTGGLTERGHGGI